MPTSNRIEDLHPDLARVYTEAKAAYIAAHPGGLRPRLGETYRPADVQAAYYAQGRVTPGEVNRLRAVAGLPAITVSEAANQITKAQPGQSAHGFKPARAFDVQMARPDGTIDWSETPYLNFAAFVKRAAEQCKVQVSQGAYWPRFKDMPHTELLNWRKMR